MPIYLRDIYTKAEIDALIDGVNAHLLNKGLGGDAADSGCVAYFDENGSLANTGLPLGTFMMIPQSVTEGNVALFTASGGVEDTGVSLSDLALGADYLPLTGGTLTAAPETEVLFITDTDGRSMSLRPTHIESAEPITLNNLKFTKGDGTYASINDDAITGQVLLKVDYSTGWTHYGNDAIRATSDGNVLVGSAGTDDEANVLQVSGSGKFTGDLVVEGTTTLGAAVIHAATTTTVTAEESVLVANQVFIDTYGILTQGGDILMNDGGGTGGGDLQMDSGDVRSVGYLEVLGTTSLSGALTGTTAAFSGLVEAGSATLSGALAGTTATFSGALAGTTAAFSGAASATSLTATYAGSAAVGTLLSAGSLRVHRDYGSFGINVGNGHFTDTTTYRLAGGVSKLGWTNDGVAQSTLRVAFDSPSSALLRLSGDGAGTGSVTLSVVGAGTFSGNVTSAKYVGPYSALQGVVYGYNTFSWIDVNSTTRMSFDATSAGALCLHNDNHIKFSSNVANQSAANTTIGLYRSADGVLKVTDGYTGFGSLSALNLTLSGDLSVGDDLTVTGDLGVTGPITGTTATFSGAVTFTHATAYIVGNAEGRIGIRGVPDTASTVKTKLYGLTNCPEGYYTDGFYGSYGAGGNYYKPLAASGDGELVSVNWGLSFKTGGSERLRVANDGTVSVATDLSVGDDLTVLGDLGVTGPITGTSATLVGSLLVQATAGDTYLTVDNTDNGRIRLDASGVHAQWMSLTPREGSYGYSKLEASGAFLITAGGQNVASVSTSKLGILSSKQLAWHSSDSAPSVATDAGLARFAEGVVKVTDGSTGLGGLRVGTITLAGSTGLPTISGIADASILFNAAGSYGEWRPGAGFKMNSGLQFLWASDTVLNSNHDTGLERYSGGVVGFTDGSTGVGSFYGLHGTLTGDLNLSTNDKSIYFKSTSGSLIRTIWLDSGNNFSARNGGPSGHSYYGNSEVANTSGTVRIQSAGLNRIELGATGRVRLGATLPTDDGTSALQVNGAITGTSATFNAAGATRGIYVNNTQSNTTDTADLFRATSVQAGQFFSVDNYGRAQSNCEIYVSRIEGYGAGTLTLAQYSTGVTIVAPVTMSGDLSVGDDLTVTGDLGVTGPITGTTASLTGLLTLGSGGASGSGDQNYVYFNNSTAQNPTIKWNSVSAATGLRFYSNTTEIARFQDNGACYFSSIGTLAGTNIGNHYISRGVQDSGPTYRMREAGDTATGLHAFTSVATTLQANDIYFGIIAPTNTATSGTNVGTKIVTVYNQASGTAANTDLLINRTQTAVGSGTQRLLDLQVGGTSKFSVSNTGHVAFQGGSVDQNGNGVLASLRTGGYRAVGGGSALVLNDDHRNGSNAAITAASGTVTNSTGTSIGLQITPTYNQTSTAGATDLLINRTQTAVGSGTQRLIDAQVGGVSKFSVSSLGNLNASGTAQFGGGVTADTGTSTFNALITYGDINCDTDIFCMGTIVPSAGIYSYGEITVDGAGINTTAQSTFGSVKLTPSAGAPTAVKGGMYFDSDYDKFYVCKNGTTWVEVTTA